MIMDRTGLLSDRQAITATTASTNIIDLMQSGTPAYGVARRRDLGKGEGVPLAFAVTEAFNSLTSLTVAIQVDDNDAFTSPKTVATSTVALADLTPNGNFAVPNRMPAGTDERFVRALYTVTGAAPTTGRVTFGVVADSDQQ